MGEIAQKLLHFYELSASEVGREVPQKIQKNMKKYFSVKMWLVLWN